MFKTVDLFAGAGGLSLGFQQTKKFKICAAAENNPNAMRTYLQNHDITNDIVKISNVRGYDFHSLKERLGSVDVVIGGPPCQGFSNANRQRNHIISMNNSLVKEYFRAIKELAPKAFIMENVSTLQSDVHRFYDSANDHTEIKSLGITLRDDILQITSTTFEPLNLLPIFENSTELEAALAPTKLFYLLNILYKARLSGQRREKFLTKNRSALNNLLTEYLAPAADDTLHTYFVKLLTPLADALTAEASLTDHFNNLGNFISLQKSLLSAKEIYDNNIICEFVEENGLIQANVQSYSVLDYICAILGDDYVQARGTLNARWVGMPQERKRYIIMGIKSSLLPSDSVIALPTQPEIIPHVTVGDAILDLQEVPVSFDKNDAPHLLPAPPKSISNYAKSLRIAGVLHNHLTTNSTPTAVERFKLLKEGQNFHDLPQSMTSSYANRERTQNTIYLKLDSKKPCGTVVNVRKSMWIHPKLDRAITVREAARLQSFPDDFIFCGTKDSQYQQVGNAVPPMLAKAIAKNLLTYLEPED